MIPSRATDLTACSFSDFVVFLFDRDVPCDDNAEPWYWDADVIFDPQLVCRYYVALFSDPSFLLARFTKAQLEQAFWAIPSGNLDCSAARVMWCKDLPLAEREKCVTSMFYLFRDLFAVDALETSGSMWWDALCFDWHCGNRKRERGGEDLWMQDVIFKTLTNILELDSEFCQGAALHGLGHLHHPETKQLVKRFVARNPSLPQALKQYAHAAAQFKVI